MRPPAVPSWPLYGFRFGEVVWSSHGGTYPVTRCRVVGPGWRPKSLTAIPATRDEPFDGPFFDVCDLFHDTPAYHAWVELERRDEVRRRKGKGPTSELRAAIEALISDNRHLLVVRVSWEGGQPHSRAACLRAWLFMRDAGSVARVEATIATVIDAEVLDCIRANSAMWAASSEMNEPWLDDEDRVILARVAEFRR